MSDATSPALSPAGTPVRTPSGGRALGRRALPGPVSSSQGMPWAETAVYVAVVPLLAVPVLLASMADALALGTTLLLTALVSWLCLARRVVIGDGWLADRRFWHYRVSHGQHLRLVELVENGHGGLLRLHLHSGRAHRLRLSEYSSLDARAGLATVLSAGTPRLGNGVPAALGLAVPAEPAALSA